MGKAEIVHFVRRFFQFREHVLEFILNKQKYVYHKGTKLTFSTPNALCDYRASSFSDKEPETLDWIDSMDDGCIFWDIGANVGIYSVYVAKTKNAKVWAFEPSVFNLEFLARNIVLNELEENIHIMPIALNNSVGFNLMRHSTTNWGGALSAFDKEYGQDGRKLNDIFSYLTFGVSLDFAVKNLNIPLPDYIKIDVDGIEHLILEGGVDAINNAKELLVEVNEDFEEQRIQCDEILKKNGFVLKNKGAYPNATLKIANQIWQNIRLVD